MKSAGLPVDGAGLLEFFRTRVKGEATPDRLAALVEQLGSKDAGEREKAAAELSRHRAAGDPGAAPGRQGPRRRRRRRPGAPLPDRPGNQLRRRHRRRRASDRPAPARRRRRRVARFPALRGGRVGRRGNQGGPDGHGLPRRQGRPRPPQGARRRIAAAPRHRRGRALPERPGRTARRPAQAPGRPQADRPAASRPGPGPGPRRQRRGHADRPARHSCRPARAATRRNTCPAWPAISRPRGP